MSELDPKLVAVARRYCAAQGDDPDRRVPVFGPDEKLLGSVPAWSLYVDAARATPLNPNSGTA